MLPHPRPNPNIYHSPSPNNIKVRKYKMLNPKCFFSRLPWISVVFGNLCPTNNKRCVFGHNDIRRTHTGRYLIIHRAVLDVNKLTLHRIPRNGLLLNCRPRFKHVIITIIGCIQIIIRHARELNSRYTVHIESLSTRQTFSKRTTILIM